VDKLYSDMVCVDDSSGMWYCGIDIGTSSTKAVLLDREGAVRDQLTLPAPSDRGDVYWYDHLCRVLDRFAGARPLETEEMACSVTGQGGSFVLTNREFQPVGGLYSWTTQAGDEVVRDLEAAFGAADYYAMTGWPPHGWLAACKLRELTARRGLADGVQHVLTVPDYVYARLAGIPCTDITSAQITGLAEFDRGCWSKPILEWAGIPAHMLPHIHSKLAVVAERVSTEWGRITLATGSHDQYAAMRATSLEKDKTVMLGTGTAWVLNGLTSSPLFDNAHFLIHPGRNLRPDQFGFIITLWQIGAGFETLLERVEIARESLAQVESGFADDGLPREAVKVKIASGAVEPTCNPAESVRRYMEWAASEVAYALDTSGLMGGLQKIVATGGAMTSRFWPQVIADVCDIPVEAVHYPYLTAHGAALHAMEALEGDPRPISMPDSALVRTFEPDRGRAYRAWYEQTQKPILDGRRA